MEKNQGGYWTVFAFEGEGGSNPGEPVTGDALNITANVYLDAGSANAVDDTNPTEVGGGYYVFTITAAESNADHIAIEPSSVTANVLVIGVPGVIYPTALATELAKVPKSDGTATWNSTALASVNAEADTALSDWGKTGFSLAADQSGVTIGTVSVLTGHTPQTDDHAANIAAILEDTGTTLDTKMDSIQTDVSSIDSTVGAILTDTAEIGTAGAGLTAIPKTGYSIASDGMDSVILPANIITASSIAADAVTELQSGLATSAKQDILDTLLDKVAVICIGNVTNAGTGTETFVYGGVTGTVTVDEDGNRTIVFS